MTTTASRFDLSAIYKLAWFRARGICSARTTLRAAFSLALRGVWADAKAGLDIAVLYARDLAIAAEDAAEAAATRAAILAAPAPAAITVSRKSIARQLDRAAARCEDGASAKQCWYLAGLMEAAGDDVDDHLLDIGAMLSRREATILISAYVAR